jgi:hypothetical protein
MSNENGGILYLYSYDARDMGVRVVVYEGEVFKLEVKEVFYLRVDDHLW